MIDLGTTSLTNGNYEASAHFVADIGTSKLTITVDNTMTMWDANAWLTAIFFNIQGATINGGDSATGDSRTMNNPAGENNSFWTDVPGGTSDTVTSDWDFVANPSPLTGFLSPFAAANYGIGSAGLGVFNGMAVDGPPGGLVPAFSALTLAEWSVFPNHDTNKFTLGTLTFVLDLTLDPANGAGLGISNVGFFFGTGASDAVVLIPLPMALPMGLLGLAGVVVLRRRLAARQMI